MAGAALSPTTFTFENVRLAAGAIASYVLTKEDPKKGVFVAYDTRFGSPAFAAAVAEVLARAGIPVKLADRITPTPGAFIRGQATGRGRRP